MNNRDPFTVSNTDDPMAEPIPLKAGDTRVLCLGHPFAVDFRVVAEAKWQSVQRQLAELKKDQARLDWLEDHLCGSSMFATQRDLLPGPWTSIRAAIDSAREGK